MYYHDIRQVKQAARDNGNHFFDPSAMRYFDSRIGSRVYGGKYFVTSERFHGTNESLPRRYTLRQVTHENGRFDIDTVGEFQQFATRSEATKLAEQLAARHALELATI